MIRRGKCRECGRLSDPSQMVPMPGGEYLGPHGAARTATKPTYCVPCAQKRLMRCDDGDPRNADHLAALRRGLKAVSA